MRAFSRVPNRAAPLCSAGRGREKFARILKRVTNGQLYSGKVSCVRGLGSRRAMPIALEQAVVEKSGIFFRIRL